MRDVNDIIHSMKVTANMLKTTPYDLRDKAAEQLREGADALGEIVDLRAEVQALKDDQEGLVDQHSLISVRESNRLLRAEVQERQAAYENAVEVANAEKHKRVELEGQLASARIDMLLEVIKTLKKSTAITLPGIGGGFEILQRMVDHERSDGEAD